MKMPENQNINAANSSPAPVRWLFAALSVLSILPYWTVRYPVITDYPNHLARWFLLFHMHDPQFRFDHFFATAWGPFPYVVTDVLGVWMQYVLPIDIVGRIILSLCVVSIPVATYFFLRAANPGSEYLALWAFVISFNPNFMMGSLGSELSVALCLVAVTLWIGFCEHPTIPRATVLTLMMSLLYLTHLIGFGVAGLVMGIYCLATGKPPTRLLFLGLMSVPGLAMFVLSRASAGSSGALNYHGMTAWEKLRNLAFPLRFFSTPQAAAALLCLAILAVIFLKLNAVAWNRPWLVVGAGLLCAYVIAPGEYSLGGYLDVRIIPCLYLFLLAAFQIKRYRRWMIVAAVVYALCGILRIETLFISKQKELNGLSAAFAVIPRDARVLPVIRLRPEGGLIGRGEIHHLEYAVIEKGLLVPVVFHIPGVQPLRLVDTGYCPNPFCVVVSAEDTHWREVACDYDYLWVEPFPEAIPYITTFAEPVFTNEFVTVYRTRRPATTGTQANPDIVQH